MKHSAVVLGCKFNGGMDGGGGGSSCSEDRTAFDRDIELFRSMTGTIEPADSVYVIPKAAGGDHGGLCEDR